MLVALEHRHAAGVDVQLFAGLAIGDGNRRRALAEAELADRAELVGATLPGPLETDETAITAREAVIAERARRAALQAAAEPAKR